MWVIRNANESDKNFIYATWLRGLYYGNAYFRAMDKEVFFRRYSAYLDTLLNAQGGVKVACLPSEAGEDAPIVGYIVYSGPVLHWCFTKQAFRRAGVLKSLLSGHEIKTVSNITELGDEIRRKHGIPFDPWSGV